MARDICELAFVFLTLAVEVAAMAQYEIGDIEDVWDTLDIPQKNRIASLLISRINISRDEIEILWNYDFDLN